MRADDVVELPVRDFVVEPCAGDVRDERGRLVALCVVGAIEAIEVVRVPGAFEIPLVARQLARSGRFDAVICLGAVIRGDTPHFEYISTEVSRGILQASMDSNIPVIFGVLTTDTVAQAIERADPEQLNRGADAAKTAIEMVNVMRLLKKEGSGEAPQPATPSRRAGRSAARPKR